MDVDERSPKTAATPVKGTAIWGAPDGFDALLLVKRAREHNGPVLHVAKDDAALNRLGEALDYMGEKTEVLRFPAWDCLPYDRVSPNPVLIAERVATLTRLLEPTKAKGGRIVLTTPAALMQRVAPRSAFEGQSIEVAQGENLDQSFLIELLVANGYTRTDTVMEPGNSPPVAGFLTCFRRAGRADPA